MSKKNKDFITFLEGLREDNRAALAHLRRGLGKRPGTAFEMFRYVAPFVQQSYPAEEEAYFVVAALFGLYPDARHGEGNLGASLASIENRSTSIDKRFLSLLNSRDTRLQHHLRQSISLLKANEGFIHWPRLLRDIKNWSHPKRFVQRDWAMAFWGATSGSRDQDTINGGEDQ